MTCFWRAREHATRHTLPSSDGQTLPSTHLSGVFFASFYRHILPKSLARNTFFPSGSFAEPETFGRRRAYLSCDWDCLVNVTPPNSGTASAHGAAPLQPSNSSLADFLLAGLPANSGERFQGDRRGVVWGGEFKRRPGSGARAGIAAVKKPADSPQDESKSQKSKESADPGSLAAHPELTVPLPVPLAPPLDFALKPEPTTAAVSLLGHQGCLEKACDVRWPKLER